MRDLWHKLHYGWRMSFEHSGVREAPIRFWMRLVAWRLLTWARRPTVVQFPRYGVSFYCPPEWRGMSKMAFTLRDHYEPEMAHLRRWVRPGDRVVDIGAHYGAYTVALAALVGVEGKVYAVEPARHALAVLYRNICLNGFTNTSVLAVALGDTDRTGHLHHHRDASRASFGEFDRDGTDEEDVQVRKLDDLIPPDNRPVSLIKIDIEGHELPALQGATHLLQHDRPVLLFELQPDAARRAGLPGYGVWDFLVHLGYGFAQLDLHGNLVRLESPSESRHPNIVGIHSGVPRE